MLPMASGERRDDRDYGGKPACKARIRHAFD
jgi:hypothetical protein